MFCGWELPAPIPHLEFVGGPMAGQSVPLHEEVTTIGSVAGNTIVLADPAVSRKHVGIRRMGASFELADLGSTNGVYVNGYRMPKKLLISGDVLRVGNTEMVFRMS
jgi:pSer/pThr/pTyr-binding forkhead associated (FHA) protein